MAGMNIRPVKREGSLGVSVLVDALCPAVGRHPVHESVPWLNVSNLECARCHRYLYSRSSSGELFSLADAARLAAECGETVGVVAPDGTVWRTHHPTREQRERRERYERYEQSREADMTDTPDTPPLDSPDVPPLDMFPTPTDVSCRTLKDVPSERHDRGHNRPAAYRGRYRPHVAIMDTRGRVPLRTADHVARTHAAVMMIEARPPLRVFLGPPKAVIMLHDMVLGLTMLLAAGTRPCASVLDADETCTGQPEATVLAAHDGRRPGHRRDRRTQACSNKRDHSDVLHAKSQL